MLLQEIKRSIGEKELSIAVPGLDRDMIAYNSNAASKITEAVDFINVRSVAITRYFQI
jgi:chitinase